MPNDKRISYEETYIPKPEKIEPTSILAGVMTAVIIVVWVLEVLGVL